MQPSKKSIEELFVPQVRYVVPMFQRKYVWQEDPQWQNLWEDIEEKADFRLGLKSTHPHYLGALIVEGVKPITGNEVTRMLVIDGQQRLTTILLLLCAFRDFAHKLEWTALYRRLSRLLENSDQDVMDEPEIEKFKLWPTTLNRDLFSSILSAGSQAAVEKRYPLIKLRRRRHPEPRSNLVEAYFYFSNKLQNWFASAASKYQKSEEDCAVALLQSLNSDFFIIHLSLESTDDAQEIFYSLNSKATPLSQSDLMRSLIFMRAEKESEDKDKIFAEYWGKLETDFWSYELKRGGRSYSRLDVGLRNFLTAKKGELIDARRVSEEYRQWITAKPQKYVTVRDELHDLIRHCDVFQRFEAVPVNLPSSDFRRIVRDFDVSTAIPLVQFLELEAELDELNKEQCVGMLESFIVRRAFVGDETKEYNKFFVDIIGSISKKKGGELKLALEQKLLAGSGSTRRWPTDEDVMESAFTRNIYFGMRTPALRIILERLELNLRGKKSEDNNVGSGLTIEHVSPSNWSEFWPLQGKTIPKEIVSYPGSAVDDLLPLAEQIRERNSKLHTLGNLTLLNDRANPAAGNYAFDKKKSEYAHSVLRLNRYFVDFENWDENNIRDRCQNLGKVFCNIWPRPMGVSPE